MGMGGYDNAEEHCDVEHAQEPPEPLPRAEKIGIQALYCGTYGSIVDGAVQGLNSTREKH